MHLRISIPELEARNPLLERKSRFQRREISAARREIGLPPSLTRREMGRNHDAGNIRNE